MPAPQSIETAPGLRLVQGRHGWMLAHAADVFIGRSFIRYGECCEQEVQFLLQLLRAGGTVVEVGANIGTHTVPLARALAAQQRRLLAYEPQPAMFQTLCANLAVNGIGNVAAQPAACGAEPGTLYFDAPDYRSRGNFGGVAMQREAAAGRTSVRCLRLDDELGGERVGLLKIDVEGFELEVLRGAAGTLARCRPLLYLENDRAEQSQALIEWLWAVGYALWWHFPRLFNPDNFAGDGENLFGDIASYNMLALPREAATEVKGLAPVADSRQHPSHGRRKGQQ